MRDVESLPVDARSVSDPLSTPDEIVADCAAFVESVVDATDADNLVIDLDGTPSAAFVAIVAAQALGPDHVQALSITMDARSDEIADATKTLAADLGISLREVDLQPMLEEFVSAAATTARERRRSPFERPGTVLVGNQPGHQDVRDSLRAVEARLRMAVTYFEANTTRGLVAGPVNRTDWLLGTGSIDGPPGVDFLPIAHLYRTEVIALGLHVGVPRSILVGGRTTGPVSRPVPEFLFGAPETIIDDALRSLVDEGRSVADASAETGLDEASVGRLVDVVAESARERTRPLHPNSPGRS